jgi:hypothetical protein
MVIRTGSNEIHFAEFDRWAEPLDEGIGRVLKAALGPAHSVDRVTLNSQGDDGLDYAVRIQVLACEGVRGENGTGSIRVALAWEIQPAGTNEMAIKHGGFTAVPAAWDGKDYGQLASLLSKAVADAGVALAMDLPREARIPEKRSTGATSP